MNNLYDDRRWQTLDLLCQLTVFFNNCFFLYGVLKAQTGLVLIYLVRVRAGGKECKCDRFGLCQIGYQADAVRGMWNSYPEKRRKKLSGKYNLTATNWWSAEPTVQVIVWMTHLPQLLMFLAFSTKNSPSPFDDRNYRRTNGVFFICRTFVQKFRSLFHLLITLKYHRFSLLLTTDQVFGCHIAFVSL